MYLQPPAYWLSCGRDSPELLSLCVSRLHGMNKVRLVNAEFIWTEPHSKRLKLKLTIQKEVSTNMSTSFYMCVCSYLMIR